MAETLALNEHWLLPRPSETYTNHHGESLESFLAYCSIVLNESNRRDAYHLTEDFLDVLKDFSPYFRRDKMSLKIKLSQVRTRQPKESLTREWSVPSAATMSNSKGFSPARI